VHASSEEKIYVFKDSFHEDLERVFFIIFLSTIRKYYYDILKEKWGERKFSSWQLGMRVCIRVVMIMVLE